MSPRMETLGHDEWGKSSPQKTFQLRSQFCGAFAIIYGVVLLGCVRTSQYSEDQPRRTIIASKF